jgi:hypothetical protein
LNKKLAAEIAEDTEGESCNTFVLTVNSVAILRFIR